jgi:hypothetical protein
MSERVSTRSSSKRQTHAASEVSRSGSAKEVELPPILDSVPSRQQSAKSPPKAQQQANEPADSSRGLYLSQISKGGPPILEAEQTILVDGSSSTFLISPPFNEDEIKAEMSQKQLQNVNRQLQDVINTPLVYYSIREYVMRKKGTVDGLFQTIKSYDPNLHLTRRVIETHIERNMVIYSDYIQIRFLLGLLRGY